MKDAAGNVMASPFSWSFTITATVPTVTSQSPAAGATGVANTTAVTATFNESVLGSSITTSNFVLKDPNGNTIAATVGYSDSNSTATLTPGAPLAASTTYTATISGVTDAAGNVMTSPFTWSFTTAGPTGVIGDPGFEQVSVGAGKFQYRPTGSPWTFSGGAGISGNDSGFTSGNPPAPEGAQVAFLQTTGSFSQTRQRLGRRLLLTHLRRRPARQPPGVAAGLRGAGRRRRGGHASRPRARRTRASPPPRSPSRPVSHTITFQGLDSAGGDNTAFIDAVVAQPVSAPVSVGDPGSSRWSVGAGKFQYRPTGSPWTFSGGAGICGNNSGFTSGNPAGPRGRAGRLPPDDRLVQPDASPAGPPAPTRSASTPPSAATTRRRGRTSRCWSTASWWARFTPSGTSYQSYTTAAFTVTAGSHTITFQGLDSAGGDNTAFIDQVVVIS